MLRAIKLKKLKPLLIKSEPDRKYTQNIPSDDNLPAVLLCKSVVSSAYILLNV